MDLLLKGLTPKQVGLLRNCVSDLGRKDADCVHIQLSLVEAILDARPMPSDEEMKIMRIVVGLDIAQRQDGSKGGEK